MKDPASPDALNAFLAELAAGKRRVDLHADPTMPTRWQVAHAARIDPEGFGALYKDAQRIGLEVIADEILSIADDSEHDTITDSEGRERPDSEWISRSRLRVESRQWLLERLMRDLFGNKLEVSQDVNHYVVELPAPITDKTEWLKQHGQQSQDAIKSLSGALSQDRKPH